MTELREHQEKAPAALVEVTSSIRGKNTQQQVATPTESGAKAWLKQGWRQLTKILHAILNRIGHALDPDNISFSVELGVGMSFGSFAITWSQPLAAGKLCGAVCAGVWSGRWVLVGGVPVGRMRMMG